MLSWLKGRILDRVVKPCYRKPSFRVFDEEWDNLIILDACRYDVFQEITGLSGYRMSGGSDTTDFLKTNFSEYRDVVYITANPFVNRFAKVRKIIPVWKYCWDYRKNTVPSEAVAYYALVTGGKKVIHFIQPHYPYLTSGYDDGSFRKLRESIGRDEGFVVEKETKEGFFEVVTSDVYKKLDVSVQIALYRTNLRIVLDVALPLARALRGRTVITADHGESFGERIHPVIPFRMYGHLPGYYVDHLVKVPWVVVDGGDEVLARKLKKRYAKTVHRLREEEKVRRISRKLRL